MPGDEVTRDTIAAVATPAGRGGIGIVRISGPAAPRIAQSVLGRLPAPRQATLALFRNARGEVIDQGIAVYFPAPRSYTGEAVVELHGHGGPVVMHELLATCLDAGARLADPGEFTRRAFLGGRMDLAQAEAVADLIDASSREAARSALRSLQGEFSSIIESMRSQLVELRALTEAQLDFPEEDIGAVHRQDLIARAGALQGGLQDVLAKSRQGALLRSGVHVVLAGRPNVGKSSLLNRLAGQERAIVTPIPGTTRDAVREAVDIDGVSVVLVDTAGLRAATDEVERLGIARTHRELEQADVVLVVHEISARDEAIELELADAPRIEVYNKVDQHRGFVAPPGAVAVSAETGEGVAELRKAILRAAGWSAPAESVFLARERHVRALNAALEEVNAALEEAGRWELFAERLRLAHDALATVTGAFTPDQLLGEIFSRFCIGK